MLYLLQSLLMELYFLEWLILEKIREIIGREGNVYKLAIAMIVAYIQGSTVWTVLPLYFKEVGLQTVEIGFLMTLSGLIGIVSGVVAGKVSDIIASF